MQKSRTESKMQNSFSLQRVTEKNAKLLKMEFSLNNEHRVRLEKLQEAKMLLLLCRVPVNRSPELFLVHIFLFASERGSL